MSLSLLEIILTNVGASISAVGVPVVIYMGSKIVKKQKKVDKEICQVKENQFVLTNQQVMLQGTVNTILVPNRINDEIESIVSTVVKELEYHYYEGDLKMFIFGCGRVMKDMTGDFLEIGLEHLNKEIIEQKYLFYSKKVQALYKGIDAGFVTYVRPMLLERNRLYLNELEALIDRKYSNSKLTTFKTLSPRQAN